MPRDTASDPTTDATVVPLDSRRRDREVTVERVETVPMDDGHYRRAVTALAVLINQWTHDTPDTESPDTEYDDDAEYGNRAA